MRRSLPVGTVLGVPVGVTPSWFIAFAAITGFLALRVYPVAMPAQGADLYWTMAFISGMLFFLSILVHELAHSIVARAFGIPVRGITLFILGGVSQISREAPRARQELAMAFAGPVTSLLLAAVVLAVWAVGPGPRPLMIILEWLWLMNFGLGIFNLVPGFPLDGGRVLRAAIWGMSGSYSWATRLSAYAGQAIAWSIIAYGMVSLLFGRRLGWDSDALGSFWLILVGTFLDMAARASWRRARAVCALRDLTVRDALEADWPQVAAFARLADIEAEGMLAEGDDHLLVVDDGRVIGIVPGDRALRALEQDASVTAGDTMIPAPRLPALAADETALEAWDRMDTGDLEFVPALDGSRFAGLVRRQRLIDLLDADGRGAWS